jgi:hypothetical protein
MKGILVIGFALFLLAVAPGARPAMAAAPPQSDPKVRELSIVIAGGQVLVSFELENGFTPELTQRMESGLPTGFVYELEMARDRRWWDASVDSAHLEVVAMFNAVTREYLVNTKLEGKLIDSVTLRDPGDLERAMTRFTALPVFTLAPSAQRARYLVRARVELGTGQVLGFIPFLKTSEWAESNKVRLR